MELKDIIEQSAARMAGVTVDYSQTMDTVCIKDDSGRQDDIFMQGDDAVQFLNEMNELYEEVQTLDKDTIALHLANPYVECLWS